MLESVSPVNTQAKPALLEFLFYAAAVLQVTIGVEICGCIRYLVARDKFFFLLRWRLSKIPLSS